MENDRIIYGNCWVTYFDMLGFRKKIDEHEGNVDSFVRSIYNRMVGEAENRSERIARALGYVGYAWFSDTFIFFTKDDTFGSYSNIELLSNEFLRSMIYKQHPLRGALTVGEFYADKDKYIFVGPTLIRAYDYAEGQKWIGLVLTPEARKKLGERDYAVNIIDYKEYEVPIKPEKIEERRLLARDISELREYIVQMQNVAKRERDYEEKLKVIYDNTLKFIAWLGRNR